MRVLITGLFNEGHIKILLAKGYEVIHIVTPLDKSELQRKIRDIDALILGGAEKIDEDILSSAPRLRVIAFMGVGFENYVDIDAATRHGVIVTYTPHANTEAVAEMAIALMLSMYRRIPVFTQEVKQGTWKPRLSESLVGRRLGIIGMGAIGSAVARMAHFGFAMQIYYYSRSKKESAERELNATYLPLHKLIESIDVLSLHCPLTPLTRGMIGKEEFGLLKTSAVLINCSRPELVDPVALRIALSEGKIAGVAIDGYYEEPAPRPMIDKLGFDLLSFPEELMIVTPHSAALTLGAIEKMSDMAVEGLVGIQEEGSYLYTVNPRD